MKREFFIAGLFIAFDQIIKIFIKFYAMNSYIVLIPDVIRFQPVQNTNLNWVASMIGITMPVIFMVFFQSIAMIICILFYKFEIYKIKVPHIWLTLSFCFMFSGIVCSFIDVVFWGGSIDFIGLFDWFTFDTKDVYLNAGWISMILFSNTTSYENSKDISFKSWLFNKLKFKQ